jgi:predicted phage terminase large subunit-like protein
LLDEQEISKELARRHLLDFVQYIFPNHNINWHHEAMCRHLEEWAFGDLKRLMVFMPPGSGKSELVSRALPAWIFGRNPDAMIMAASYGASLASDMNRDVQRIMESDAYAEIFSESAFGERKKSLSVGGAIQRNSEVFEIAGHKGYYKCAGVGGSITGKRFFHGIIDDPLKGRADAESITIREKLWGWYRNDFYTRRLNQDAKILITLTRWHADDLAGRLLEQAQKEAKITPWRVVKFPMIAEDDIEPEDPRSPGDPLWPWRFGDIKEHEALKIESGPYTWSSLYQQRPSPPGGMIFSRGKLMENAYEQDPKELVKSLDMVIQSWDCSFKDSDGTDYVVGQILGRKGPNRYLLDQVRARMDFPTTVQTVRSLSAKWPEAKGKYVEDKANGSAVIATLKREIPGFVPVEPQGGKVVRALAVSPYIESGNVWLPMARYAPWIHDFVEELANFPNAKYDDQVDAFTQGLFVLDNQEPKTTLTFSTTPMARSYGATPKIF